MRAKDWNSTELGPPESWPQSLRTAVSLLLNSRYPMFLFWGPQLIKIYNDGYRPITGDKHPWALGRPGPDVWPEIWADIGPMVERVIHNGEATWSDDLPLFMRRRGFPEEVFFTFSYSPVRDESGGVGGMFCACTETTAKVQGERRLKVLRDLAAAAAEARTVADACVRGVRVLAGVPADVPFALLYLLEEGGPRLAASAGVAPEELPAQWPLAGKTLVTDLGACFARVPAGPWPEPPSSAMVLPLAGGALVLGVSSRIRFDDSYRSFFELVAGQLDASLSAARASEAERRRAEALAELDRAKTAFFSNVSHEFRTPLTLILGPLEQVLSANELPPAVQENLAVVQRNAQRLLKLVNTLLDFARIEAGRAQASYQAVDLAALTADLASNFRSACESAGLALEVDCPPLDEPAWVDREMWEKIVLNLLSNAFKFTLEGAIRVSLRAQKDFVLEVRDTGTGIPAHELPRMFERFHRVEGARGRSHEGSGIGLALVHELVKLHGGSIAVDSPPGRGSVFSVRIPRGSAHLPAESLNAPREGASTAVRAGAYVSEALSWLPGSQVGETPAKTGQRVLVVDDNADLRAYAARLLSTHYEVEAASDGAAALAAARARAPDIVVADVMMPGLDGFGLLRELRADVALRSVPVLLLSARAGEEARIEGLGRGADDYLVKPFSALELLVRVAALLQSAEIRRQALEAERRAAERFRALLEQAPLGMYLVDADFRIREVNPIALSVFGDVPGGVIGRDFREIMQLIWDQDYAEEIVRVFRRTLETGEPYLVSERAERRADRAVTEYYEWRVDRIPLPDGRDGVVCYFRDISAQVHARKALERSEEALREADRRKDEFIATLSHELRNPLAPLSNALEILRLTHGADEAPVLAMMERQVKQLVRLTDDLLEMSRITRGSFELRRERTLLGGVVRNALETAEPLIRAARHGVTLSPSPDELWVDGDPVRLAQIVANLLSNAAKYTDEGGSIIVEVRRAGAQALVSVRDNGAGLAPHEVARVFDMFVRGERSTGLGIGLALARRLAEMHGGTIEAASAGRGRGAEFTLRLPLADVPAAPSERAQQAWSAMTQKRVLVIDDNRDAADSLGTLLEHLGAEVRVVHDARQALAAFQAYRPGVVLLDLGMPEVDGYQVARAIRADERNGRVPLVALTGWGQEEDRRRVREAGFDHHLVKPADIGALRALLGSL